MDQNSLAQNDFCTNIFVQEFQGKIICLGYIGSAPMRRPFASGKVRVFWWEGNRKVWFFGWPKKMNKIKDPKGKWTKMGKYLPKNARKKQGNSHNPNYNVNSTQFNHNWSCVWSDYDFAPPPPPPPPTKLLDQFQASYNVKISYVG